MIGKGRREELLDCRSDLPELMGSPYQPGHRGGSGLSQAAEGGWRVHCDSSHPLCGAIYVRHGYYL